jgi:hypothetical protein
LVNAEPGTVTWFAIEEGPSSFAIFDTFNDEAGRDAHLNGKVAAALMACFKAGTKSHTNKVELGRHGRRFAIPVHDRSGTLLAYCGRTASDESPALVFPNVINPARTIFNAHRITKGELYLVRDPLQVLQAFESGIENVVAFPTDGICPQQFEELSSIMDERKCDIAHLYQLPQGSFFFQTILRMNVHNGPPCRIKTKRQENSALSVIPSRQHNPYGVAFPFTPSSARWKPPSCSHFEDKMLQQPSSIASIRVTRPGGVREPWIPWCCIL